MLTALVALVVGLNPAAASVSLARDWRTDRPLPVLAGAVATVLVLTGLAVAADPVLRVLDIELGTFRLGAGVVLVVAGLRWLVTGAPAATVGPTTDVGLAAFVCFPVLLTPGAAVVAVSVGSEHGTATAALAATVAAALGGLGIHLRRRIPDLVAHGLVRFVGAGAVVVGIGLAFDGIRTM